MTEIVPTILANDIATFNQYVAVYRTIAKRIQIDISDNAFSNTPTVSLDQITLPTDWNGTWDFHMMVSNPSAYLPKIIQLHPSLCIFHAECNENLLPVFEQLANAGIKTGVAILQSTYPGAIKPYIEAADHVLIFGGILGQQGGKADLLQLEKVSIIKAIDPNVEIGWDGGANISNVRAIAHSDIKVINVGSALSHSENIAETLKALEEETEKQGVNI